MKSPQCARLAVELTVLTRSRHTTDDDIARRIEDHTRWHQCDNPWTPPPGLPRDPHQEMREGKQA